MSEEKIIAMWVEYYLPSIISTYEIDGQPDRPARRESFKDFTDMLYKDEQISEEMYNEICIPDNLQEMSLFDAYRLYA